MSKKTEQIINLKLLTLVSLSSLLLFTPVTLAGFKPTNRKPASDYSRSAGKRGCPNEPNATIPLTLLAPQTYIGFTASLRPTFVGFVSNSQQVEFRVFEFISDNRVQQIGNEAIKDAKSGIFTISLPEKYPDLSVGKKYLWQLTINCSENNTNIVEAAEFMVVETPSTLKNVLSTTSDDLQKAHVYAEAGLWYESLAEAVQLKNDGKLGKLGSTLVNNVAEYESPRIKDKEFVVRERIQNLQTIATQQQ
ncbi:MAG: DUF928 domain-containing protein [Goleter apudmare HA4340-LM2]|jgi:hypothetical protein|nr:DUF928 domain-containing protein [Goleter apudmare HA4340-LM2]